MTTALMAVGAGMGVAGKGVQMYGEYKASTDQYKQELENAKIAKAQAQQIRRSGAYEEYNLRKQKERYLGLQKAQIAESGFMFEGSPLEIMVETASEFEKDIQMNKYNNEQEAGAYDYEAKYRKKQAKQIKTARNIALLSGGLSMGSKAFSGMSNAQSGLSQFNASSSSTYNSIWGNK